jgi:hypothetical protein
LPIGLSVRQARNLEPFRSFWNLPENLQDEDQDMSIFDTIRNTIASFAQTAGGAVGAGVAQGGVAAVAAQPQPLQNVDVEAVLTERQRAKGGPQLNWRTSIADLMRLLDLDPSLENRKALATELGYTGARDGSAEMNMWLHRKVMEGLAANGGRVPAAMAD